MSARSLKAKGFTLVEILIVVVILGILAAIVIPQFTSASEAAKASSLVTQLQSIRSQIELYQIQHNGDYPGVNAAGTGLISSANFWSDLTGKTNVAGVAATTGTTYGPYLQKPVINPFTDSSLVVGNNIATGIPNNAGGSDANGFIYNPTTGQIKAVIAASKASEVNLDVADGDITTY